MVDAVVPDASAVDSLASVQMVSMFDFVSSLAIEMSRNDAYN